MTLTAPLSATNGTTPYAVNTLSITALPNGSARPSHWSSGTAGARLGYAVAAVILVRLIWATTGVRQLGLSRFYPVFTGLRLNTALTHPAISRALLLGIAISLIGTTATGIMMDRGRAIGAHVGRFGEYSSSKSGEDRNKRCSKTEPHQSVYIFSNGVKQSDA